MEYALAAIMRNLPTIAETRITFPIQGEVCPPRECHLGDGGLPGGGIDHTCVVGLLGTTMLPLAGYMRGERGLSFSSMVGTGVCFNCFNFGAHKSAPCAFCCLGRQRTESNTDLGICFLNTEHRKQADKNLPFQHCT